VCQRCQRLAQRRARHTETLDETEFGHAIAWGEGAVQQQLP
jgi:hypothetical protein